MTGGEASMSDEMGAEVSAWGDCINRKRKTHHRSGLAKRTHFR
jgi:hypothetical protein